MNLVLKKLNERDEKFIAIDKRFDDVDKRFDAVDKRFDQHDKRFDQHDKRFDQHDKRFDQHDKRFDQLDRQIDLLAYSVLDHTERLDRIEQNMVTKDDLGGVTRILDHLVVLAERKDQELVVLAHDVKKVIKRVEVLEKGIA